MSGASAAVLRLWEHARGSEAHGRAVVLAEEGSRAFGLDVPSDPGGEPLGQHHARLLRLRAAAFGRSIEATAPCPECAEVVSFGLDAAELAALPAASGSGSIVVDGYGVDWRLPSARDLAAAAASSGVSAAEAALVRRCVVSARGPDGGPVAADDLPAAVRDALSAALAAADPLAEVLLDLDCPMCGLRFASDVDVAAFVWAEVEARAKRVLLDVDALARAYGWTEADVLVLSDERRAAYLRILSEGTP